jgi:hypothetical protein
MIDVNEKVMITLMFLFESRVGVSLATIIIISFQLRGGGGVTPSQHTLKFCQFVENTFNGMPMK